MKTTKQRFVHGSHRRGPGTLTLCAGHLPERNKLGLCVQWSLYLVVLKRRFNTTVHKIALWDKKWGLIIKVVLK